MNRRVLALTGFLIAGLLLLSDMGKAADFTVSSSADFQAALTAAADNGENDWIYMLPGIYEAETTFLYASSESYALTIVGAGPEQTILSGRGINRVLSINIARGLGATIIVQRLKIADGGTAGYGGGLSISSDISTGTCVVQYCIFENNRAAKGGGLYVLYPTVTLEHNTFRANTIAGITGDLERGGAGAHVISVDATIRNNEFSANGSAVSCKGGGLFLKADGYQFWTDAAPVVEKNLFRGNYLPENSDGSGAYIYCFSLQNYLQDNVRILHNRFIENSISGLNGSGGGLFVASFSCYAPLLVVNNAFVRNAAPASGAAHLWPDTAMAILTSNTSINNQSAENSAAVTLHDTSGSKIYNNIFWSPLSTGLKSLGGANVSFFNNDVYYDHYNGGYLYLFDSLPLNMGGNISRAPSLWDYHIVHSADNPSPLVDAGENSAPELAAFDLDAEPRIMPFNGNVDIGADEFNAERPYLWAETARIAAPNVPTKFGYAVALDGDTLVVGAPYEDEGANAEAGAAYIFERNLNGPGQWGLRKRIARDDGAGPLRQHFGWSVAVDGDTVVIGSEKGGARIYNRSAGGADAWGLEQLVSGGYAVAVSKNIVATGYPWERVDGFNLGTVRVFVKHDGLWQEHADSPLSPHHNGWAPTGDERDGEFGSAVSVTVFPTMTGSTCKIVVGAPNHGYMVDLVGIDNFRDPSYSGAVYTFVGFGFGKPDEEPLWSNVFDLVDQLDHYDVSNTSRFGKAVSTDGQTLVSAGDYQSWFFQAAAFWEETYTYADVVDSVAHDGDWAAIGIPGSGKTAISYRYSSAGTWRTSQSIQGQQGEGSFGHSIGICGNTLAIGVPDSNRVVICEFPNPPIDIPAGYVEVASYPGLIVDGTVENIHWYEYFNEEPRDLMVMLQSGSTFKIEAFAPGDDPGAEPSFATDALGVFPIELALANAATGLWTFKIVCLQSKNENPYTFAVLAAEQGGGGDDITPPDIIPPADITVEATSSSGAVVDYPAAMVSDIVDLNPTVVYSHASGSLFPVGVTIVTITATDASGNTSTAQFNITVEDTTPSDITPPDFTVSVSPRVLWPPDHRMVPIIVSISVHDDIDPAPVWQLKSITMNEGDDMQGDGKTENDIQIDGDTILLRAERSGRGSGRVYTITYLASDASGNQATASATVTVPHNQKPKK